MPTSDLAEPDYLLFLNAMSSKVQSWLANPDRTYAEGVKLLLELEPNDKFAAYFSKMKDADNTDIAFNVLTERMERLAYKLGLTVNDSEKETKAVILGAVTKAVPDGNKSKIQVITIEKVEYDNLPAALKKSYDRVREITPIMSTLHAQLAAADLTDEQRMQLANELCDLDDERHAIWNNLDNYAASKDLEIENPSEPLSDDPITKGIQIVRRIDRLKENIARYNKTIEKSTKPNIIERNKQKLVAAEVELKELEVLVNE